MSLNITAASPLVSLQAASAACNAFRSTPMHWDDSTVRCNPATSSSCPASCGAAGMRRLFKACTHLHHFIHLANCHSTMQQMISSLVCW